MVTNTLDAKRSYLTFPRRSRPSDGRSEPGIMDRIRSFLGQRKAGEEEYAPLTDDERLTDVDFGEQNDEAEPPFSWLEYSIFALIGVAMLWAW
jgi:hypothetical protein